MSKDYRKSQSTEKLNTPPWLTSQWSPIPASMVSWWWEMQPEPVAKTKNGVVKNLNVEKSIADLLDLCPMAGWKAPE